MKRLVITLFVTLAAVLLSDVQAKTPDKGNALEAKTSKDNVTQVQGTDLSKLVSAMEVLSQIPNVTMVDGVPVVNGKTTLVRVNGRNITDSHELWRIPADRIENVRVITSPGAQYGKQVQAVIEITLSKPTDEGFHLNNLLRFDLSHKLVPNDELTMTYKRNKLDLNAFLAVDQASTKPKSESYTDYFDLKESGESALVERDYSIVHPVSRSRWFTMSVGAGYDINLAHRISAKYTFKRTPLNTTKKLDEVDYAYGEDEQGVINLDTPVSVTNVFDEVKNFNSRHDVNVDYVGRVGKWELKAGLTYFNVGDTTRETKWLEEQIPSNIVNLPVTLTKENDVRVYANATTPLWRGNLGFGVEFERDALDLLTYDSLVSLSQVHTNNSENMYAAYVNAEQKFGTFDVSVGVRYETSRMIYKPYLDDTAWGYLHKYIEEHPELMDKDTPNGYIFFDLMKTGRLTLDYNRFYPNLSVGATIGNSHLTLSHTQSYNRPYKGAYKLKLVDLALADERMLRTEVINNTALTWNWKWLELKATHFYFERPLCSSSTNFTGKSYHAMEAQATVTGKISFWSPSLMVNVHKQWFNMEAEISSSDLNKPLAYFNFINQFALPHNWLVLLNMRARTRGANRITHYYSGMFGMDASVQKDFVDHRLTLILQATNMLNTECNDVSNYSPEFVGPKISGSKNMVPQTFSLSARYMF